MYTDRMQPRGISAIGTLVGFIGILLLLGVLWVASGGPSRSISREGPFLSPPTAPRVDVMTGRIIPGGSSVAEEGGTPLSEPDGEDAPSVVETIVNSGVSIGGADSPYAAHVTINKASATQSDANKEYVTISVSRKAPGSVTMTGWVLESKKKAVRASLGSAANVYMLGSVNNESPVTVPPGGTVYVTTGRPQSGVSFRVNECSGYLDQFQTYYPKLDNQCASPEDEMQLRADRIGNDAECEAFVDELSSCQIYTEAVPSGLSSACRNFVVYDLTYNGCVALHRADPDFFENEWRMYLSRDQELWENGHDTIRLLDENGKLIASVTY